MKKVINNKSSKKLEVKLKNEIEELKEKTKTSEKVIKATAKAREARTELTNRKIIEAIMKLSNENKNLSQYAITKLSGCSVNTVRKFLHNHNLEDIKENQKVEIDKKEKSLSEVKIIENVNPLIFVEEYQKAKLKIEKATNEKKKEIILDYQI